MHTKTEDSAIIGKTKELCAAILEQPAIRSARQNVEAFMSDDKARAHYEGVMTKGQELHQKQHRSEPLSREEIAAFEQDRDALLKNPVTRGFLDAQEEMHRMHESINAYVSKTFELGRVPTEDDLESGGCGNHDCGCGHGHEH